MSCWSALRRSPPNVLRVTAVDLFQFRRFSASSLPPESASFHNTSENNGNGKPHVATLISAGVVASCAFALSLCSFSTSSLNAPSVSFADYAAPPTAALVAPLSESPLHDGKKESKYLFGDAYRRKIFFNYEKRIRMRSPPEKVFEYFASVRTSDGEIFMTPADLMRAMVPVFPPSESDLVRDGYLRGERSPGELRCAPSKFFMLFDTNNDGLISFKEYLFFVTLLSIPESSFSVAFKMFDLDCNGTL